MRKFRAGVGLSLVFLLVSFPHFFLGPILANGLLQRDFVEPLVDSPARTMGSDFNGDGIADVGIAARGNDDGGSGAGAVYILYGAGGFSQTYQLNGTGANVTILGKAASDSVGSGGSNSAGDVNSDGFDDLLMGTPGNSDGGSPSAGATYILFGSSSPSATYQLAGAGIDLTVLGKNASDNLGGAASGVGDANDDGFLMSWLDHAITMTAPDPTLGHNM